MSALAVPLLSKLIVAAVPSEFVEFKTLDPGNNSDSVDANVAPAGTAALAPYATHTFDPC